MRTRLPSVWRSLAPATRLGLAGGAATTLLLGVAVALAPGVALGLGMVPFGARAGTLTPATLRTVVWPAGAGFLLPGLVVGVAAGLRARTGRAAGTGAYPWLRVVRLTTVVPAALVFVLGLVAGAALTLEALAGGIAGFGSVLVALFVGLLAVGVGLGGATAIVVLVGVPTALGFALGRRLPVGPADRT